MNQGEIEPKVSSREVLSLKTNQVSVPGPIVLNLNQSSSL
jgi:hypothetical protein